MKLRFSERAFADREDIFEYLDQRSPEVAQAVFAYLAASITQLIDLPHTGARTDDGDVRVLFIVRYPYKVFYRVRGEMVEILHIRHTSRRPLNLE
jgi:toxin ParE1/3/4